MAHSLNAQLEALLFSSGRPMSANQLAKLAKATPSAVKEALGQLKLIYQQNQRGLIILEHEKKYQMLTHPDLGQLIDKFRKEEFTGPLSRAALETLAIVAYRGPILKPEIDTIRGVNSSIMLRTLLVRGLVERKRSAKDARTFAYSLSMDFIRYLGVTELKELPQYEELHNHPVMERFAQSQVSGSIDADKPNKL